MTNLVLFLLLVYLFVNSFFFVLISCFVFILIIIFELGYTQYVNNLQQDNRIIEKNIHTTGYENISLGKSTVLLFKHFLTKTLTHTIYR